LLAEVSIEPSIKVLVADAHPFSLDGLARAVRQDARFQLAAALGEGADVLAEIRRLAPHVAVVDADLEPISGTRIVTAVRRERLDTHVLLFGEPRSSAATYRALAENAAGWLPRRISTDELRRALIAAAAGDIVLGAGVPTTLAREIRLRNDSQRPALSDREDAILRRLAEGLLAPAIARELVLSLSTVKTHLRHLYEKLDVNDRAAAVAAGMRLGLLE
jgi:two-component system, NarL family, nitrate/nitrite response regulator NarL